VVEVLCCGLSYFFVIGWTGLLCPCVLHGRNAEALDGIPWTRRCACHAVCVGGGTALSGISNKISGTQSFHKTATYAYKQLCHVLELFTILKSQSFLFMFSVCGASNNFLIGCYKSLLTDTTSLVFL
jgi:hypothetical protein